MWRLKDHRRKRPNSNESLALLQTQASSAEAAKLMLNLHDCEERKKRDRSLSWGKHDRCTQIRGVWGKSWVHDTIHRDRQGWLNGADDSECHETLSHPASARFPVYSLLRRTLKVVFLGYFFTSLMSVRVSLSNVWYDIQVKESA